MDIFKLLTTVDSESDCIVCKSANAIEEIDGVRRCRACKSTFAEDGARIAVSSLETIVMGNIFRLIGGRSTDMESKVKRLCLSCSSKLPINNRCLYAFRADGSCDKCHAFCSAPDSVAYKGEI
jgi:ribosomal protein L37AE/L43A